MTTRPKSGRLLLVRHTVVTGAWRGRCYGVSDVPLAREGRLAARVLAQQLGEWRPNLVFSSPLRRARVLAAHLARAAQVPLRIDERLCERDFGSWEGRSWNEIYAETGDAMMGMLTAPDSFRPGAGETTMEMRERALSWYRELPSGIDIVAISHGGPIAALVGTLHCLPHKLWSHVIPLPGDIVAVPDPTSA